MEIFAEAFAWLKGLAIVNWGIKAIKQLWPFLLALLFWPEFDALMCNLFPFWEEYISSVLGVLKDGSYYLRELPILNPFFTWFDKFLYAAHNRILDVLLHIRA